MKSSNFGGDLTDNRAEKEALFGTSLKQWRMNAVSPRHRLRHPEVFLFFVTNVLVHVCIAVHSKYSRVSPLMCFFPHE